MPTTCSPPLPMSWNFCSAVVGVKVLQIWRDNKVHYAGNDIVSFTNPLASSEAGNLSNSDATSIYDGISGTFFITAVQWTGRTWAGARARSWAKTWARWYTPTWSSLWKYLRCNMHLWCLFSCSIYLFLASVSPSKFNVHQNRLSWPQIYYTARGGVPRPQKIDIWDQNCFFLLRQHSPFLACSW